VILVTVGTHEDPFDRLVRAAEVLAGGERVVLQKGPSTVPTPRCEARPFLAPEDLAAAMRDARIVVAHAGPSTLLEAAACGHVPVVVPRSAAHGEHVDDHQLRFARRIADRVHVVEDPARLPEALLRHAGILADLRPFSPDAERTLAFARDLEQVCASLSGARSAPPRLRDRLRALRTWMNLPS
jgi:UDP-N-acetylglucosamine transferase subunit ALG13